MSKNPRGHMQDVFQNVEGPEMSQDVTNRRPHYRLALKDNESGRNGTVGVAWLDDNGAISIYLNPGVQLGYEHTRKPMTLRLFPINQD